MQEELFAQTTAGLERVLLDEVRALGHAPVLDGVGVRWTAPPGGHQEANLWLRTATRVWLKLDEDEVPPPARRAQVASFIAPGTPATLTLDGGRRPGLAQAIVKALQLRPPAPTASPDAPELWVRAVHGRAALYLDTSGAPLFRRGYRQEVSRAPMHETLAAGLLALAGYDPRAPLRDGLCGSGTLLIEAALRGRRRAPGIARAFAFEGFPSFDPAAWSARLEAARAQEVPVPPGFFRGGDINAGSLGTARRNARRAGVLEDLELLREDVAKAPAPEGDVPGLWISNLPYGRRLEADLAQLYRAVAETWRRACPRWTLATLVEDGTRLEKALGAPTQRHPVAQGGLRCALLVWRP